VLAWSLAEAASGLRHLTMSPRAARIASPFDYAAQTRIIIVNDIRATMSARSLPGSPR